MKRLSVIFAVLLMLAGCTAQSEELPANVTHTDTAAVESRFEADYSAAPLHNQLDFVSLTNRLNYVHEKLYGERFIFSDSWVDYGLSDDGKIHTYIYRALPNQYLFPRIECEIDEQSGMVHSILIVQPYESFTVENDEDYTRYLRTCIGAFFPDADADLLISSLEQSITEVASDAKAWSDTCFYSGDFCLFACYQGGCDKVYIEPCGISSVYNSESVKRKKIK